ncbi:helix-turn-helix domain-containing protein [Microbacterium sp. HMH0099]|uniref:helix-turn-helix domain-containing protein n=1 Tax=Microbacterium sp. HMH0099 TaxID=3414026 RepID=UPI003BF6CA40
MGARVEQAVAALRAVAARPYPTAPLTLASIAAAAGSGPSTASRLCADLVAAGALARGDGYGTFRLGPRAIALSGRAAAPLAAVTHFELHRIAQDTSETVLLAAPERTGARVVASVGSGWTLHVPAGVGDLVEDDRRAVVRAARGDEAEVVEAQAGRAVEIAVALSAPDGRCVAVLAVCLPVYRAVRARTRIRRVLLEARRAFEKTLAAPPADPLPAATPPDAPAPAAPPARPAPAAPPSPAAPIHAPAPRTVEAALRLLERLAAGATTIPALATASGIRPDRVRRLVDGLLRTGMVHRDTETDALHLDAGVHGWHRAAMIPLLEEASATVVPDTAARLGTCVFVTTLRGMRSFTLVEHIEPLGEGLLMTPWLGRPHPLVGSDGGPTLAGDFAPEQLAALFPRRHGALEYERFVRRAAQARADGVLVMESPDEFAITSVSAPVRDSSGLVAAAACIVGASEDVRPRLDDLRDAARALAAALSARLCGAESPPMPLPRTMG